MLTETEGVERFKSLIERMGQGETLSAEDYSDFMMCCRHASRVWETAAATADASKPAGSTIQP